MKKQLLLGPALCLLTQVGQADPYWGYDTRYSGGSYGFSRNLPDVPVDVPSRPLTQKDWSDLITCGDILEILTPTSNYRHPAPQFFYSIKDDRITVFTPHYAGIDRLRCQTHTFGIKHRETEKVCYMAIPYRPPLRRPETWGYYYTASAIGLPGFTSDTFASGGPFSYFHEVNQQRDADALNFADEIYKSHIRVTNFQNQRVIPFQIHPKTKDLWGPGLSLDPDLVPQFIRNLAQLASVARLETSIGLEPTIDRIDEGLSACERVSARIEAKNLQKAVTLISVQMKASISAQRRRNITVRLDVRPLRKEVGQNGVLAVEAIISNDSQGVFETDLGGCRVPVWTAHPKGYFMAVLEGQSHCRGYSRGLGLGLGAGKNLTPSDNMLIIGPGVTRSFILYLPVGQTARLGPLEFSLAFGRRNPIQSSPQKVVIVKEGK